MKLNNFLPSLFCFLTLIPCTSVSAQVVDDFEDGTLDNPTWTGDRDDFVVRDGRLRLMAESAGVSTLEINLSEITAITELDSFELDFLVDMDFAPSASNFCQIELVDDPDRGLNTSGIYMNFGGISGDEDTWTGFGISGGDVVAGEFSGPPGALGSSPATVRFKITYAKGDRFRLFADYTGGTDFELQGELEDYLVFSPTTLTIRCTYSATRTDKFSFDDLNLRFVLPEDFAGPQIMFARALSSRRLQVAFDEIVLSDPLTSPDNYVIDLPGTAVVNAAVNGNSVNLDLNRDIPLREDFNITVNRVEDRVGNQSNNLSATVNYDPTARPTAENLLITELMVATNPVVGLPNREYVELYNLSDSTVDMNGTFISSGGARRPISGKIAPKQYAVITELGGRNLFADMGANVLASDLPGLTNSGDNVTLSSHSDTLLSLDYTDAWYHDDERDDGGYSIEYTGLAGADAGCSALWRASLDPSGGTPGRMNSVIGQPAMIVGPELLSSELLPDGITLTFSEPLPPGSPDFVLTEGEREVPLELPLAADGGRSIILSTAGEDLSRGILYTLQIPEFTDCAGNVTPSFEVRLGIFDPPTAGDVIINEILFNPGTGGSDFVELYNCSDRIFQINGWILENTLSTTSNAFQEINSSRLFLPGEFLTFTDDPADIMNRYRNVDPDLLVNQSLPSLPDDAGNITLSVDGDVIDSYDYDESFHSELLDDQNGVSLERIRYKVPTGVSNNWFSAASVEDYGTPTRANSQLRGVIPGAEVDEVFSLTSTTFSPDEDGFEDFLEINYKDVPIGSIARIRIFDTQGRSIRTLRNVELLGAEGSVRWDGATDERRKAKAGAYVLYLELINPAGPAREQKLVAVLAGGAR